MTEERPEGGDRILLVDDNPTNLKVLHDTLKDRGYELRIAKSGEQALTIAEKSRPDLVLLDIMMPPGIDGYETIQRLKQDPEMKDTPVVFLSALNDTHDKVKGLDLGAVDFISKPFQAEEVIARVNTHLTTHRLRQELARQNKKLEDANERMQKDLNAAARVQQALLPTTLPEDDRLEVAWQYRPCDELAGDSLNVHQLGPNHVSFFIVDVSGHGVPAALLSVSVTRNLEPSSDPSCLVATPGGAIASPAEVAQRLNDLYRMEKSDNYYFTMVYGVLDLETSRFRFITAGHPGPILIRPGAQPEQIVARALFIGYAKDFTYSDSEVQLAAGDRLYLFSDGLYEEANDEDEQFEISRLMESLASRAEEPLEASIEHVRQDLADWHGDDNFTDDFSILAVEILAP